MIVLRPAVILKAVAKGTLTDCGAAGCVVAWFEIGLELIALHRIGLRRLPWPWMVSEINSIGF